MPLPKKIHYAERKKIEKLLNEETPIKDIAYELGVSRELLYRELRKGGYKGKETKTYKAEAAQMKS